MAYPFSHLIHNIIM